MASTKTTKPLKGLTFMPMGTANSKETLWRVYWFDRERSIGDIYMEVDGYYVFAFDSKDEQRGGFLPSWFFKGIHDKLEEMNKAWDAEILNTFGVAPIPIPGLDTKNPVEVDRAMKEISSAVAAMPSDKLEKFISNCVVMRQAVAKDGDAAVLAMCHTLGHRMMDDCN